VDGSVRYGLALLAGTVAGGVAFLAADGATDPTTAWWLAVTSALSWAGSVPLYLPVYERFDGPPVSGEGVPTWASVKVGLVVGFGGGTVATGLGPVLPAGTAGGHVTALTVLILGLFLLGLAAGMDAIATGADAATRGSTRPETAAGDGSTGD
jgi:hypothetical protein